MRKIRTILLALGATAVLGSAGTRAQQVPPEWPLYRGGMFRGGNQSGSGPVFTTGVLAGLANPSTVKTLHLIWTFPVGKLPGPAFGAFIASPVVNNGIAYVGNTNGEFYAIDMKSGKLRWMFPDPRKPGDPPPLNGTCGWGKWGIQASAAIYAVKGEAAVFFGAPDPDKQTNNGNGSGRIWALDAGDGHLIWKSDVVARVTGCTNGAFPGLGPPGTPPAEFHENMRFSTPLPLVTSPSPPGEPGGGGVYIGIASNEDPIQLGAVREVDLWTGKLGASFLASEGRFWVGGDVWNGPASDGKGIFFTTGNARQWDNVTPSSIPCFTSDKKPAPGAGPGTTCIDAAKYGLSLVRIDPDGFVRWYFQPLPINLDQDPDWNAGATVMNTDCGELLVSVMKDGWTYALNANDGTCVWQFPDMGNPGCKFPTTDTLTHGDNGFRVPGATWGNLLVIATGGYALPLDGATSPNVRGRLHALEVCQTSSRRGTRPNLRWLLNPVPNTKNNVDDPVSAPTIINGLIYLSTDLGHLMVYADTTVLPPAGKTCDDTSQSLATCSMSDQVNVPTQLVDITLPDVGDAARFRKEVVLAEGLALVSTSAGHVYAYGTNSQ